jgi:hypothetical protein
MPRSTKEGNAIIIVMSGIVPPAYRLFCDAVTRQIKGVVQDSLNGKIVGDLYAGDIEHRGVHLILTGPSNLGKSWFHENNVTIRLPGLRCLRIISRRF